MRYDIYNAVSEAIIAEFSDVHCGSTYEVVPKEFPYVYIHELNEYDASPDIYNEDEVARIEFEVQIFSHSSPYGICKAARQAFKVIGFIEDGCEFPDNADPSIRRAVMKFKGVQI